MHFVLDVGTTIFYYVGRQTTYFMCFKTLYLT